MKNFIVLLLSLFCFIPPAFAGNLLQQTDEIQFVQKTVNNPMPSHYGKIYLLREDYMGYKNGKNAFYGYIVNGLKDVHKSSNSTINKQYLQLIKNKIDSVILITNSDIDYNRRLNFNLSKITVDDTEYKLLSENTKLVIQMYNYIVSGDH